MSKQFVNKITLVVASFFCVLQGFSASCEAVGHKFYDVSKVAEFYKTLALIRGERGDAFRPEQFLVVLDVDGTLTLAQTPVPDEVAQIRGASTQVVRDLKATGVHLIACSAWDKVFETMQRIRQLGLAEEFGVSEDPLRTETRKIRTQFSETELVIVSSGNAVSIRGSHYPNYYRNRLGLHDEKYYRQKAFVGMVAITEEQLKDVTDIFFLDDSVDNIHTIQQDIVRFGLYTSATIHYFTLARPSNPGLTPEQPIVWTDPETEESLPVILEGVTVATSSPYLRFPATHTSSGSGVFSMGRAGNSGWTSSPSPLASSSTSFWGAAAAAALEIAVAPAAVVPVKNPALTEVFSDDEASGELRSAAPAGSARARIPALGCRDLAKSGVWDLKELSGSCELEESCSLQASRELKRSSENAGDKLSASGSEIGAN